MSAADEDIHGPFFEALEKFKDYLLLERGCSQNTVKAYISDISFWHAYCLKMGFEPEKLSAENISRFLREQTVKGKAKSTIQRNAAVLNSFACFLVYDGELSKMPKLDPLPKIDDKLPQIMTENEIQRIIDACEDGTYLGKRDRAVIELAYGAGMRASELCGIKLKDINKTGGLIYTRGKGGKERGVPYLGAVRKVVDEYIDKYRPQMDKLGQPWLFLTRTGKQMRREFLWHILRKRGMSAGIPLSRLHPHVLRHTFATHLLRNGMDQRTLQEILGHSSIMTTEKYTHLDLEIRDLYDKFHPRA
jgi:integrase/recombinase XerD